MVYQKHENNSDFFDPIRLYLRDIGKIPLWSKEEERHAGKLLKIARENLIKSILKRGKGVSEEFPEFYEFKKEFKKFRATDKKKKYWFVDWYYKLRAIESLPQGIIQALNNLDDIISKFMEANLRLVVSGATKRSQFLSATNQFSSCLSLEDLIQDGNFGLRCAIERFDPDRGFKFSTYATWWIKQSVARSVGDNRFTIRIPIHVYEILPHIERLKRYEENAEMGDQYSAQEAKKILKKFETKKKVTSEIIERLSGMNPDTVSLNTYLNEGEYGGDLSSVIEDTSTVSPEDEMLKTKIRERVSQVLDKLSEREKNILIMRFNLNGEGEKTLQEVGDVFHITRERTRQVESKALKRLRVFHRKQLLDL